MSKKDRLVKEFRTTTQKPRAGFVPGYDEIVENWQLWCTNVDTSDSRRATRGDLKAAGYKRVTRGGKK